MSLQPICKYTITGELTDNDASETLILFSPLPIFEHDVCLPAMLVPVQVVLEEEVDEHHVHLLPYEYSGW